MGRRQVPHCQVQLRPSSCVHPRRVAPCLRQRPPIATAGTLGTSTPPTVILLRYLATEPLVRATFSVHHARQWARPSLSQSLVVSSGPLRYRPAGLRGFLRKGFRPGPRRTGSERSARSRGHGREPGPDPAQRLLVAPLPVRTIPPRYHGILPFQLRGSRKRRECYRLPLGQLPRSEEHTSELQS